MEAASCCSKRLSVSAIRLILTAVALTDQRIYKALQPCEFGCMAQTVCVI